VRPGAGRRLSETHRRAYDRAIEWAQTLSWSVCLLLGGKKKPCLSGAFVEADDGTRTHDLLHGKDVAADDSR
jgi:hypothetical protein